MNTLEDNLSNALEAVRFVKSKMKLGAKNKINDLWKSKGASISCVQDLRSDVDNYAQKSLVSLFKEDQFAAIEREAEFTAAVASHMGCGNCNEQAALAFIYLRDKGIYPLDWINKLNPVFNFGGHSFVVIGRIAKMINPSDWGDTAVICDPHGAETAYPASQIEKYMPKAVLEGKLRLDSKSSSSIRVWFD